MTDEEWDHLVAAMRAKAEATPSEDVRFLDWQLETGHLRKDVDVDALRANLLLTPWERLESLQSELNKYYEWRDARENAH